MCTVYGYARVSTLRQKLQRQIDNIITAFPNAVMVTEKHTGTSISRPEFDKLIKVLKPGDRVVFDSVSRMSRTAQEGYELYMSLYSKGIDLTFLKEPMIDTDVYRNTAQVAMTGTDADCIIEGVNKYLLLLAERQIQIAFDQSQKEVDDLHGRISEGLKQRQLKGLPVGRQQGRTYETKKSIAMKEKIVKMSMDFRGSMTDKEVMETLGIARNSYYKYKRQIKEQGNF